MGRSKGATQIYQLAIGTPLPNHTVIMSSTENKRNLINLICDSIINDIHFNSEFASKHKLILTGEEEEPLELHCSEVKRRPDLRTMHEEADVIIVQQAIKLARDECVQVKVLSDDTDVFLLLLHFYHFEYICSPVFMLSPVRGHAMIDIKASTLKHKDIVPDLLAAHTISGCDSTAMCYGIGKNKVLKALKSRHSLSCLGDQQALFSDVEKQASKFMVSCYGKSMCRNTSEARVKIWADKVGSSRSQVPHLCSLPPTNEAFSENVKRAHFQTGIWKNSMECSPPEMDPELYGYNKDINSKQLLLTRLPKSTPVAPPEILQLVKCGCESLMPCKSSRCGCKNSGLPCTIFCSCTDDVCCNQFTRNNEVEAEGGIDSDKDDAD